MEWAIVVLILLVSLLMILSIFISKRFSMAVFIFVFLAGAAFVAVTSDGENVGINILVIGFVLAIGWIRLPKSVADTARARTQLLDRLN